MIQEDYPHQPTPSTHAQICSLTHACMPIHMQTFIHTYNTYAYKNKTNQKGGFKKKWLRVWKHTLPVLREQRQVDHDQPGLSTW